MIAKQTDTDGHYLCVGCKRIASFEDMEVGDNRLRYYPKQELKRIKDEEEKWKQEQEEIMGHPLLDA